MIIGSKIFDCQHGPDRKKNEKDKSSKQKVKYKRQLTFISSRNMNKCKKKQLRESSFNMTRRGDEDIEGGLRKFLDTRKGGSEKIRRAPKICIF